jgi:hypothetical protein
VASDQQHKAASLPARRGWVKKYDANKANLGSTWNSLSTIRRVNYWEIIARDLKKSWLEFWALHLGPLTPY